MARAQRINPKATSLKLAGTLPISRVEVLMMAQIDLSPNLPCLFPMSLKPSVATTPDVRALLENVLLNKQVLLCFEEVVRTVAIDITRALELTGQPVKARKAQLEMLRLRTEGALGQLSALLSVICTAGGPSIEQKRPLTPSETGELCDAEEALAGLEREIDAIVSEYQPFWSQPVIRQSPGSPDNPAYL